MPYGTPTLPEIIDDLKKRVAALESVNYVFGNEDNANNDNLTVTNLKGVVSYYTEFTGTPKARITWTWDAPPEPDSDDLTADPVVEYYFSVALSGDNQGSAYLGTNKKTTVTTNDLPVMGQVTGSVYAVTSKGLVGPTTSLTISVAKDTTAPPQPSAPVVKSALRGVTVQSDGNDVDGNQLPSDVHIIDVYKSTDPNFVTSTATFFSRQYGLPNLFIESDSYDPIYVRFIAVDTSGNQSVASATGSASPTKVNSTDMNVVLPGDIAYSDVSNLVIDGSFESEVGRNLRSEINSTDGTEYLNDTPAKHGSWVLSLGANKEYQLNKNNSEILPISLVGQPAKLYIGISVKTFDYAGTLIVRADITNQDGTTETADLITVTEFTNDWTFHESVVTFSDQATSAEIVLITADTNTGSLLIDSLRIREIVSSTIIEDGAITRAKIGDAAITDAHIESLSGGKIRAGTLDVVSATFGQIPVDRLDQNVGTLLDITSNSSVVDKATSADLSIANGKIDSATSTLTTLTNRVVIDANGVTVKSTDAAATSQVNITNNRLNFNVNNSTVAYIDSSAEKMYIGSAEVTSDIIIGNHMLSKYNNEITILRWVG